MRPLYAETETAESTPPEAELISRANRIHSINDDYYVTYNWASRPGIGANVLVVKLFDKENNQVQDLDITAESYMPGMSCCPAFGEQVLRLNRNGDYLVPITFTMLGVWAIILSFGNEDEQLATKANRTIELLDGKSS